MQLGILSDVHGDIGALEAVLERLDDVHKVDRILCAGDLVGRGPDPNAVVTCIRERNIPTVKGNHDEWSYELSPENAAYLKQLPIDWQEVMQDVSIFMCHGKPGNNLWGMYRDHLSPTYVNMMMADLETDVVITGHTHMPLYMRVDRGCLINPGSIYMFHSLRPSSHTYGVLHLPELTFEVFDLMTDPVRPLHI